ncbi:MAG: thioredoxin [Saccharofermentans sp.]|nr:thioredoxin [Saccharofermentans sp.]
MAEITLTSANFDSEVMNSDKPVLIDFWATWCGPCRMLGPVIEEIANEHPEIKVCKVNVDEEQALALRFNVDAIPLLVVMKNGEVTNTSMGFQPKDQVLELLK